MPRPQRHVFVCSQNRPAGHPRGACAHKGANEVLQSFWQELQARELYSEIAVTYSGCIGPCEQGANVLVYPEGVLYRGVQSGDVAEIFTEHLIEGRPVQRLVAPAALW